MRRVFGTRHFSLKALKMSKLRIFKNFCSKGNGWDSVRGRISSAGCLEEFCRAARGGQS